MSADTPSKGFDMDSKSIEEIDEPKGRDNINEDEEYTLKEQRKIIHKVDRRLLLILGAIQAVSFLDRANMSNANIAGMSADLDLNNGNRYAITLLVFFGPYILFQLPSTAATRKFGARNFMSAICFGFVKDWRSLIPLRMLLGAFESGFLASQFYLIASWYSRYDLHKRTSFFYLVAVAGSAFGGVLGLLFSLMGSLGSQAGWRWIFIMESLLTIVVGVLGYIFMVDFPENAHKAWGFLREKEKDFIIRRINRDRLDAEKPQFTFKRLFTPALDWKVWGFALCFFCATIQAYSVGNYLPLILQREMGFTVAQAQALSSPPYIAAMILMFVEGWVCDRIHLRSPCIIFNCLLASAGLCMMTWTKGAGAQYVGTLFVTAGCSANIPGIMVYQANNIRGPWKRAFCSASLTTLGGIGGIGGSLVFREQDAPQYVPGIITCLTANGVTLLLVSIFTTYFYISNKRASEGKKVIEGLEDFRYTY
ncbi:hypothetical protein V496_10589 [Pseudogymnoascus sp. VKM F-4515 (FW-2607)]|nr:hypothetical protein V496_10589 [Pseudogymnoascus sp. VKM F-4515 (FW-2607)]KFY92113.1 hypothetical protein V498_05152 [Pseudogymnoascus sp. VKM F-4517 (FW-2822)]